MQRDRSMFWLLDVSVRCSELRSGYFCELVDAFELRSRYFFVFALLSRVRCPGRSSGRSQTDEEDRVNRGYVRTYDISR